MCDTHKYTDSHTLRAFFRPVTEEQQLLKEGRVRQRLCELFYYFTLCCCLLCVCRCLSVCVCMCASLLTSMCFKPVGDNKGTTVKVIRYSVVLLHTPAAPAIPVCVCFPLLLHTPWHSLMSVIKTKAALSLTSSETMRKNTHSSSSFTHRTASLNQCVHAYTYTRLLMPFSWHPIT